MVIEALHDGYPTTINLSGADTTFWEETVQPPGIDGGEPINLTNMRNDAVRTRAPRHLYDVTPMELVVAYDPTVYDTILANINVNQAITTTFPDEGYVVWYGYLQKFVPGPNKEGEQPKAAITLVPTNIHSTTGLEAIPVVTGGSGTGA